MGLLRGCARRRRERHETKALEDKYELLEVIGTGKTGQVFRARHRQSRTEVAVKIVRTAYLDTPARQHALQSEIAILRSVKHPAVLKLFDVFEDDDKFAIVTERACGGELMPAICSADAPRLRECDVIAVVRELLSVLAYLHAHGITHRDIKMENILCKAPADRALADAGVLLIDFGLAHRGAERMRGMNGTCHYMAPEMFGRASEYGCEIDVWALGVVTYVLLFGRLPFDAKFLSQVEDKIAARDLSFPTDLAPLVSPQATKFIEYLLVVNPHERPPASMALRHPWLRQDSASTDRPFSDYHMTQLRRFVMDKHAAP